MRVKGLHIYPVKGLRALDVTESAVESRGLAHDRRWMIVDETGKFITQRENPMLAAIGADIGAGGLRLSCEGSHVDVATPGANAARLLSKVWKSEVNAYAADAQADAWLSRLLKTPCRLVYQGDAPRAASPDFSRPGDEVSFADGYPLLVTTAASLWDLNGKMQKPLPMDRFRPNIVIDGAEAWAEDSWSRLQLGGGVEIEIVKPCTRCVVTTTDQKTGARDGQEPLATLKQFRLLRTPQVTGVVFGQNAIPRRLGMLRAGDAVAVLQTREPPVFAPAPRTQGP